MPTGYTANIAKGISFEEYALTCARAFGACIDMRDDAPDAEIPEAFEPSPYHLNKLAEANAKEEQLLAMTEVEAGQKAKADHSNLEQGRLERLREMYDLKAKYEAMLDSAKAWEPPTADHEHLKKFMIEQIESSMRFDCDTSYYEKPTPLMDGKRWLEQKLASVRHSIEYHREEHQKELRRVELRNAWIKALRENLSK